MEGPQCLHIKADGARCRSYIGVGETGLCRMHDPAKAEEVQAGRFRGGKSSPRDRKRPKNVPKRPRTLEDAAKYASWLAHAVTVGDLDTRSCREAAGALKVFQSLTEKREMEKTIERLEAKLVEYEKQLGPRAA